MTVEEAESILRKLCPDLEVSTRPHKGVTVFRGTLTPHSDVRVPRTQPIHVVRHRDGEFVFMNGHDRKRGLVETLRWIINYSGRDRVVDVGPVADGTVAARVGYGPAFDWEGVGVYFELIGMNDGIIRIGWSDEVWCHITPPARYDLTPEMRAMAAAIVAGDDSAVGGLVDYLIEYSPEFAKVWDEATEWAAMVTTGTVMRPLEQPGPVVKTDI